MMRLIENNIKFVKEMQLNGMTYSYFVSMKSNSISDSRSYINYENDVTVAKEYEFERLPKSVQNFINHYQHNYRLFDERMENNGSIYSCYIYE